MARYSDADRAIAIEIIQRHNGNVHEALTEIRRVLDAPALHHATAYNWWNNRRIDTEIETVKKEPISQQWIEKTLDQYFEDVARLYLARASTRDAVMETKGKDAIMAAAIAVDKMRLLRDLPTEIISILPGLVEAIQKAGYDPQQVLGQLKDKFDSVYQ